MKRCILLLLILALIAALMCGCDPKTDGEAGGGSTASTQSSSSSTQSDPDPDPDPDPNPDPEPNPDPDPKPEPEPEPEPEPDIMYLTDMPEELFAQLKEDVYRLQPFGVPSDYFWEEMASSWEVFGVFGEAYVFLELRVAVAEWEYYEIVDKLLFRYPVSRPLCVYLDGRFYSLPVAFDSGILSAEQLQQVYDNYYTCYPDHKADPEPEIVYLSELPEDVKAAMALEAERVFSCRDYFWERWAPEWIIYGEFGEKYVMFQLYEGASEMVYIETVNGLKFWYPDILPLCVYADGSFYPLQEAFDGGILSAEELQQVYDNYYAIHPNRKPKPEPEPEPSVLYLTDLQEDLFAAMKEAAIASDEFPSEDYFWEEMASDWQIFGVYDGAHVMFYPQYGFREIREPVKVNGLYFYHEEYLPLCVYYDGSYYSLQDAFDQGLLNADQLRQLYDVYSVIYPNPRQPIMYLTEMPEAELAGLKDAAAQTDLFRAPSNYFWEEAAPFWEIFGVFDGAYVMYHLQEMVSDAAYRETVNGLTFYSPSLQPLCVYCDGAFYSLQDAFDSNILDASELQQLHDFYSSLYPD